MSGTLTAFWFHTWLTLQRHLRRRALWGVGLATPIAARYILPEDDATYAVMSVNDAALSLTPASIGLQMGVVTAVLLAPLAYIFLRVGPARHRPWQVTDLTTGPRWIVSGAQWVGDTLILWGLALILALAAVILSIFRLPLSEVNPLTTVTATLVVAAPALAVIAGLRQLILSRPRLRGALGDVVFVVLWMALLIASIAAIDGPGQFREAMFDVFGFAVPIIYAVEGPISGLVILGPAASAEALSVDVMSGVLHPHYVGSRLAWIGIAALLALFAGATYGAERPKRSKAMKRDIADVSFSQALIPKLTTSSSLSPWIAHTRDLVRPLWLYGPLLLASLSVFFRPFSELAGPALAFLLIFPLSQYAVRWRAPRTAQWLDVSPVSGTGRLVQRLLIAILLGVGLVIPGLLTGANIVEALLIGVSVPTVAVGLGWVARSAVPARLVLLIAWYVYLNMWT